MANAIITGLGSSSGNASGRGTQNHIFYATNSARWWCLWFSSTNVLASAYSTDFITWTTGATLTLAQSHNSEGRNFSVAYANISSTDVVHVDLGYKVSNTDKRNYHVRGTIATTTLTWGTEAQVGSTCTDNFAFIAAAINSSIDTNNKPVAFNNYQKDPGDAFDGNFQVSDGSNADTGGAWTAGFAVSEVGSGVTSILEHGAVFPLASGDAVAFGDDGVSATTFTNMTASKRATGTWGARASTLAGALGTAQDKNDWGATAVSTSDIHLVTRTGSNTYTHRRYNGTTWSAGQTITNQNSKAVGGILLTSDGTDVWMFIIDSDVSNTVRYCKWTASGPSWGTWTALESSSATRTALSGSRAVGNSTIGVIWTQTNGANFDIYSVSLSTSVAETVTMDKWNPHTNMPYFDRWKYVDY